jgi:hypothetical protein
MTAADELRRWKQRIKTLNHHERIFDVRVNTIVSVITPVRGLIAPSDWGKKKFSKRKIENIIFGINKLVDAYRWAGTRTKRFNLQPEEIGKVAKIYRISLANVPEFVVELFQDTVAPENYLWCKSTFPELDRDQRVWGRDSPRDLAPSFGDLVEQLLNREMPTAVRLQLDSLSCLLMHNPVEAAFLYWGLVDIELNKTYKKLTGKTAHKPFPEKTKCVFSKIEIITKNRRCTWSTS